VKQHQKIFEAQQKER